MGRRQALLIATHTYRDPGLRQLTGPAVDVRALADVLSDPDIAGFEVTTLVNEPHHVIGEAIGDFYRGHRRDDLGLLYFTGHGCKDESGQLYLAMANTRRDSLLFTSLPAEQLDRAMRTSRSRQLVLILDCCYSGAYPSGSVAKSDPEAHSLEPLQGRGRTVLTASDALQYSFEGDQVVGAGSGSVFTRYLVEGLRDGSADVDNDGDITLDELYTYVHERVVEAMPGQRPMKQSDVEGRTVIARNIHWRLPDYVAQALTSPITAQRLVALDGLAHLHRIGNPLVRAQVLDRIRSLTDDDSRQVSGRAEALLDAINPLPPRVEPTGPPLARPQHPAPISSPAEQSAQPTPSARTPAAEPLVAAPQAPPTFAERLRRGGRRFRQWGHDHPVMFVLLGLTLILGGVGAVAGQQMAGSNPVAHYARTEATIVIPGGNRPTDLALSPDGRRAYVTNTTYGGEDPRGTLSVLDTKTNAVTATVPLGGYPSAVATTPDGEHVYVTNKTSNTVTVLDTATNTVTKTLPLDGPSDVAVSPDGHRAYTVNSGSVSLIDTVGNTVIASIRTPAMTAVVVSADGRRAYLDGSNGQIWTLDTESRTVTLLDPQDRPADQTIGFESYDLALSSDNRYLYAAAATAGGGGEKTGILVRVGTSSRVPGLPISGRVECLEGARVRIVGRSGYLANIAPKPKLLGGDSNQHGNTLSVFDPPSNTVTDIYPMPDCAAGFAVSANGRAYIASMGTEAKVYVVNAAE